MALGRVRHNRSKAPMIMDARAVHVQVAVWHNYRAYSAQACINKHIGRGYKTKKSCGRIASARSPQSAFAKALKSLAGVAATRGRNRRRKS